jgi:hypothetical protein
MLAGSRSRGNGRLGTESGEAGLIRFRSGSIRQFGGRGFSSDLLVMKLWIPDFSTFLRLAMLMGCLLGLFGGSIWSCHEVYYPWNYPSDEDILKMGGIMLWPWDCAPFVIIGSIMGALLGLVVGLIGWPLKLLYDRL